MTSRQQCSAEFPPSPIVTGKLVVGEDCGWIRTGTLLGSGWEGEPQKQSCTLRSYPDPVPPQESPKTNQQKSWCRSKETHWRQVANKRVTAKYFYIPLLGPLTTLPPPTQRHAVQASSIVLHGLGCREIGLGCQKPLKIFDMESAMDKVVFTTLHDSPFLTQHNTWVSTTACNTCSVCFLGFFRFTLSMDSGTEVLLLL